MNKGDLKKHQVEVADAWRVVMGTSQGRLVIREVLRMCGNEQSPFTGATNQTIKNIGMQDVALQVKQALQVHCLESYFTLIREELDDGN